MLSRDSDTMPSTLHLILKMEDKIQLLFDFVMKSQTVWCTGPCISGQYLVFNGCCCCSLLCSCCFACNLIQSIAMQYPAQQDEEGNQRERGVKLSEPYLKLISSWSTRNKTFWCWSTTDGDSQRGKDNTRVFLCLSLNVWTCPNSSILHLNHLFTSFTQFYQPLLLQRRLLHNPLHLWNPMNPLLSDESLLLLRIGILINKL